MINEEDIPSYYKGKNGYMAKDVVSNFDLSYNVGTAANLSIALWQKTKQQVWLGY
jgi:hypothetical protein